LVTHNCHPTVCNTELITALSSTRNPKVPNTYLFSVAVNNTTVITSPNSSVCIVQVVIPEIQRKKGKEEENE